MASNESESEAKKQAGPSASSAEAQEANSPTAKNTDVETIRVLPSPNGLALLRTFRRIREEIGDSWLGQVLFNYEHPEGLLNTLSVIPHETLQKIQHLRVRGNLLMLTYPGAEDEVYHRLLSVLKLLPGLRLDRLTVLGFPIPFLSYAILNQLVLASNGWKELRYISHDSTFLAMPRPQVFFSKINWMIHVSGIPNRLTGKSLDGSVLDIDKRELYEQSPPEDAKGPEEYGLAAAPRARRTPSSKEIMAVSRRGYAVDYEEKRDSPILSSEIRTMCFEQFAQPFDEEDCFFSTEGPAQVEVDRYVSVEEYTWVPLDAYAFPIL
ncbi:hypothetical protein AK830_g8629 [Neonectria ditissima]|uniref:Uncharacterized protein n=1 Tax=Neonectria ditissima TaxID=78410 RepID=A0A0P7BC04_9HYPO|nr:hypothetical protein AK830_g8629 [Neonectria ditissima]